MARLFNSTFENSLRIAILLDCFSSAQTVDMLYAADFMTIYGKAFGVSEADLNGDNQYKFSENNTNQSDYKMRRFILKKSGESFG